MRYKILSPKYIYYSGLFVLSAALIFLAFLSQKAVLANELVAAALLTIFLSAMLLWCLYYVNKFIYASIDLTKNKILYGNIFFYQEADLSATELKGNLFFFSKIFKIRIGEKKYFITAIDPELDSHLKQLIKS